MVSKDQRIMFVFPGQGAQYTGIGSDLYADFAVVRKLYAEAADTVGYDIASVSFEGPEEELRLTRHTQPALLTHEIACLEAFRELTDGRITPVMAAGHSLGEYAALVAAGVLSFADGLRLVQQRGELMGRHGEGGMVALGLTPDEAAPLADRFYCEIASCNLPQQTVIGGRDVDLDALEAGLPDIYPRKRATRLKTEGAFHTYLMVAAAREFRSVLDAVKFAPAKFTVLSNYTAGPHDDDPAGIRTRLFFQLFKPVNWVGCVQTAVADGITTFVEFGGGIGPGEGPANKKANLEAIMKRNLKAVGHAAEYLPVINDKSLRETAAQLG